MFQLFINPHLNIRFSIRIILTFYVTILVGCSSNKNSAPDRKFYFEVIAPKEDRSSAELAKYIQDQIPKKKYTITNHSGTEWPFYKALDIDETISRDSLMPPHWYVHQMIPFRKDQVIKPDEFLVRIELIPGEKTLPAYKVEIFRMDSVRLTLVGKSGIHDIDSSEFTTLAIRDVYLKSIIRYSFK